MKKLIKFTTKEVVTEFEKEIELPAYFVYSKTNLFSKNPSYLNIVKIVDPDKRAVMIEYSRYSEDINKCSYSYSCWSNSNIINSDEFTQVDESEWNIAVEYLINDIKNG